MSAVIVSIFDLLKSALWPALILFILWKYGSSIRSDFVDIRDKLMPRLAELNATGIKLHPASAAGTQSQPEIKSDRLEAKGNLVSQEPNSPAAKAVYSNLMSEVSKLINEGTLTHQDAIPLLVNRLTYARLASRFDRVYSMIFGSQMKGLRDLRERGGKATLDEARSVFEAAKQADPAFYRDYNFDLWINFLKNSDLVSVSNDTVSLTDLGQEFLRYAFETNLSFDRRG